MKHRKSDRNRKRGRTTAVAAVITIAALLLAGCGAGSGGSASESSSGSGNGQAKKDRKILVAYFSASGNTKSTAEKIAEETGADLFEIQPEDSYSDEDLDWTEEESRVNKEHEKKSLQNIRLKKTTPDGFDDYDVVFIGYPIWWGDAAWPVNNFVKDNDFSGKTVIPFCTSTSSSIGDSGDNLKKMAGTGNWQSGERFSENASSDEIKSWIDDLNL